MENRLNHSELFEDLLHKLWVILQEEERRAKVMGNAFTLFDPHIIKDFKENLSSWILAMLLDPSGEHGQGIYFLRQFLQLTQIPDLDYLMPESIVAVKTEWQKIDITIFGKEFVIGIENKINPENITEDQPTQLSRYLDILKKFQPQKYYAIYLKPKYRELSEGSLDGEARKNHKDHYFLLDWDKVTEMLRTSTGAIPPKIAYFINDFCDKIEKHINRGTIMSHNPEVVTFLAQASTDQLKAASEIYASFYDAASRIILHWAESLKNRLQEDLPADVDKQFMTTGETRRSSSNKYDEIDYLSVLFPKWQIGIYIYEWKPIQEKKYNYSLRWGLFIVRDKFGDVNESWLKYLKEEYQKNPEAESNNLLLVDLESRTNLDFLLKIKMTEPPYLYQEIMTEFKRVQELREKFEKGHRAGNAD